MQSESERDEFVMTLVESALGRPPQDRSHFLREVCTDPALFEEIQLRMEWEERMGDFLCDPILDRQPADRPFGAGLLIAGRFRIVREVGAGGMGVVYEAMDEKLDRRVALKCARAGHNNRLPPEVRAAREVSHYNVCKVHDIHVAPASEGEIEFLSMEFIEGETLADRLDRVPRLAEPQIRSIARQICSGLAQAHRQGVIHGDIKCANILLATVRDGSTRAVVTDFGLARFAASSAGRGMTSDAGGTLDYMAPELFLGARATIASDLYALGVALHRMLAGHVPARLSAPPARHEPEPRGSQDSTLTMSPSGRPDVWERKIETLPAPWDRVVKSCLATLPEDRPGSADEILRALDPPKRLVRWSFASMAVVLCALAAGLWEESREKPTGPPIRLAVLPVVADEAIKSAAGIGHDVAYRLAGLRKNFTVIPPSEISRNPAKDPSSAKTILGATHVFQIRLKSIDQQIAAEASIVDTSSGSILRELHGTYGIDDTPSISKALVATATGTFHLKGGIPRESVSTAAYPFYVEGNALMRRDDSSADEAMPYFNKASQMDPRSALPYAGLAEAQLQKYAAGYGRQWLTLADQEVAKARTLNPDSESVLLVSGLLHRTQGAYELAVKDLTRVTEIDPNNGDAWLRLADVYGRANRSDEAVVAYQKSIELQPGYYSPYLTFGDFYYYRADYKKAEEQYRRVTAVAPEFEHGHSSVGLVLMDEGRYAEAEKEMLTAKRLRETRRILNNLGALYNYEGRDDEAIKYYEASLATGTASIQLYHNMGDTYRRLGQKQKAAAAYRAAKKMAELKVLDNPRDAFSRIYVASLSARLGDRERAEFEASQALSMQPTDSKVKRFAVLTYETLGQRQKSLDILRDAPPQLINELNRQPDVRDLQHDARFVAMVPK